MLGRHGLGIPLGHDTLGFADEVEGTGYADYVGGTGHGEIEGGLKAFHGENGGFRRDGEQGGEGAGVDGQVEVVEVEERQVLDPTEVENARWVSREDMLEVAAGRHPGMNAARKGSIANFLITNWLADRLD